MASAKASLEDLANALRSGMTAEQKQDAARRKDEVAGKLAAALERTLEQDRKVRDQTPIRSSRLWEELAAAIPPDAAIYNKSGTAGRGMDNYIFPKPGQLFNHRGGGLGTGLGGTLGLQL